MDMYRVNFPYYDERKELAKNEIRKASNRCGVALIIMLVFMYVLSFLLQRFMPAIRQVLPQNVIDDGMMYNLVNLVFALLIYVAVIPLLVWYCNKKAGIKAADFLRFPKISAKSFWKLVLMGIGVLYTVSFISGRIMDTISGFFRLLGIEMHGMSSGVGTDAASIVLLALSTGILAPLFEEIFVRGSLVGTLGKFGGVFAAIATGCLFGFMHTNFEQVPYAMAMGIYSGFVAYRTRSVWPGIVLHLVVNGTSVLLTIAMAFTPLQELTSSDFDFLMQVDPGELFANMLPELVMSVLSIIIFVLVMIGLVTLFRQLKRNPQEYTLPWESQNSILTLKEKCKAFFFAPGIVIFFGISIFFSFFNAFFG